MKTRSLLAGALVVVTCLGFVMVTGVAKAKEKLPGKYTETITTKDGATLSFDMVLIPGGTFTMGSPANEPGRSAHEGPQREVRLSPFYLCKTETTIGLFLAYYQETGTAKKDFLDVQAAQKNDEHKTQYSVCCHNRLPDTDSTSSYHCSRPRAV